MSVAAVFLLAGIACHALDYGDYDAEPALETGSDCMCTSIKLQDENTGLAAGDCLTRDSDTNELFCYVNFNSGCPDKFRSARAIGLFVSFKACENRNSDPEPVVAAFDVTAFN